MSDYLELLEDELADAKQRLLSSEEPEGRNIVRRQIREVKRDILRMNKLSPAGFVATQKPFADGND